MTHARRLIRRHFDQGLKPAEEERLRSHLRGCESCRAEYDELAELLRLAAGQVPTRRETDQLRRAALAAFAAPAASAPTRAQRSPWLVRLAPLLAAGCLVLVTFSLTQLRLAPQEPQVQLKGGLGAPALLDLRMYAVRPAADGLGHPQPVADGQPLALAGYLQFGYLNENPALSYLYLVGVDAQGRRLDYFPRPAAGESVPIIPSVKLQSVGRSIRLAQRHVPGALWIYALFSRQPLRPADVHALLPPRATPEAPPALRLGPEVKAISRWVQLVPAGTEDQ